MIAALVAVSLAHADAFVLEANTLRPLSRAVRVAQQADASRIVAIGPRTVCVELNDPEPRQLLRMARKLGAPPVPRDSCDVAWFPLGLGWLAVLLEPPATGIEDALPELDLPFHDLRRHRNDPLGRDAVRLCLSLAAVDDPKELADALEGLGYPVRSLYEVGGCIR